MTHYRNPLHEISTLYLYRAVDKEGKTIDFLLRAKRDKVVAMRCFEHAIQDTAFLRK